MHKQKTLSPSPRWDPVTLLRSASDWRKKKETKKLSWSEGSMCWPFLHRWGTRIEATLTAFVEGKYQFYPLKIFHFPDEAVTLWSCEDQLALRLILENIKPTFKYFLSPLCYSAMRGVNGVKDALCATTTAFKRGPFRYVIRFDINGYYASINHLLLLAQLQVFYKDPRLLNYFKDVITALVDNNGVLFSPSKGIPRRSSLSPFFGSAYLSPVDRAFENRKGVSYTRYVDDGVILCETKSQFISAKKRLKKELAQLKLKLSPHKTKMGKITSFHFLGVNFKMEASQNDFHQTHKTISPHPRTCRRALDKVRAMREDAAFHPAHAQHYLILWALWWARARKRTLAVNTWLISWVDLSKKREENLAWLAGGGAIISPVLS